MKYYFDTEFLEYTKKPYFGKLGKPVNTIELISIGMVAEDGREYYAICKDFNLDAAWDNEWLWKNVIHSILIEVIKSYHGDKRNAAIYEYSYSKAGVRRLIRDHGKSQKEIAEDIKEFVYSDGKRSMHRNASEHNLYLEDPKFYAYHADYDWVVFCWLFGRMIDLPKGFPMYCKDLKQILDDTATGIDGFTFEQSLQAIKNDPNYPSQENEHNALADARWNHKLHQFLNSF